MRLTASGSARLSPSGRDGFRSEPDGQASSLAQGGVILGPIRDPGLLLGDAVTASGIDLEGHGRIRNQEGPTLLSIQLRPPNRPFGQQGILASPSSPKKTGTLGFGRLSGASWC
jgi:hypothetical protein